VFAERPPGWRGALGQVSAARAHLANQMVGAGDLFLFWGLFRPVETREGRWRYVSRPVHAIFGWLQVAEVLHNPGGGPVNGHPWLERHPHVKPGWGEDNTIFLGENIATSLSRELPGFGVFRRPLVLTAAEAPFPSLWQVPDWLHPAEAGTGMTYHPPQRWLDEQRLRSAARGQEFVADVSSRPAALEWVLRVIEGHR
jgi:hypothetical protein